MSKYGIIIHDSHFQTSLKIPYCITTMRCCDQGAHILERLTANRSDLTLQGGSNQHGTQKPRRTPRTNLSTPRLELQEPAQRHIVSRAQRETTKSKHIHPNSPRLLDSSQELGAGSKQFLNLMHK